MSHRLDEEAVGQTIAFLVAGVVFIGSIGGILFHTATMPISSDAAEHSLLKGEAASILDMLAQSPGIGMEDGPETFERFGLLDPETKALRQDLVVQLCGTGSNGDSDDARIDYGRIMLSLGLAADDGLQFHLQILPTKVPAVDVSNMRTAYIGHMAPGLDLVPPYAHSTAIIEDGIFWRPSDEYVEQLDAHFSVTALSERATLDRMGVSHKQMPDAYASSVEGLVEAVPGLPVAASLVYAEETLHGDQYFDHETYLSETLAHRVDEYDLILIGTDVDHDQLTPLAGPIRDWVMAGGKLLMLGTSGSEGTSATPDWLEPLISQGTPVSNVPADDHPIFKSHYRLAPDQFKGSASFTFVENGIMDNVLPHDGQGSYLALSRCGSLGSGFVARLSTTEAENLMYHDYGSTFQCAPAPGALRMEMCLENSDAEFVAAEPAEAVLQNAIAYGHLQDIYMDLGPPIPPQTETAHAMRIISFDHPVHGSVPMQVHLFAWKT